MFQTTMSRRSIPAAVSSLVAAALLAVAVTACNDSDVPSAPTDTEQAPEYNDFGFAVEPLGAGVKEEGIQVSTDPDRPVQVVQANIHLEPDGGNVPWHTHPGPVIGVVTGGGTLTIVSERCTINTYPTGSTFRAPDNIHTARNESGDPVTVVAQFIIPAAAGGSFQKPTTLEPADVRSELDQKCGL